LCILRPQHVLATVYRLTKQVAQRMEHLRELSFFIFTENDCSEVTWKEGKSTGNRPSTTCFRKKWTTYTY